MFQFPSITLSKKHTKHAKSKNKPTPAHTGDLQRNRSSSLFGRLFASKKPANGPHEPVPPLPSDLPKSLPFPSPISPQFSSRQPIRQPPVFQRPTGPLGTAASGIILPRRKDGRDLWTAEDNVRGEEPGEQERLKSQILVAGWLDNGAAAGTGEAGQSAQKQEREHEQDVDATPAPSSPPKLVLHIDTSAHMSPSTSKSPSAPALVVDLVDSDSDSDDGERDDRLPELDPSASSTAGSPSIMTYRTGDSLGSPIVWSPSDTSPPPSVMLLPTIAEPDTTTAEDGDQFSVNPPQLGLSPKKPRRSVLGITNFGSRRFTAQPHARANTTNGLVPPSPISPTSPTAKSGRRLMMLGPLARRQSGLAPPSEAELALAEEKMIQPTIHTMGTLTTHIMNLEDEEERRLADLAYFG